MAIVYFVIPCFNEEAVLGETSTRLLNKINNLVDAGLISDKSRIIFVDDGSKDNTWAVIENLHKQNKKFTGLKLSRNVGQQYALLAGLMEAKDFSDAVISMDADLQDDIDAIDKFIEKYNQGNEIVYGVKKSREKDTFFKRSTALLFYRLMSLLGGDIVYNHADCRLMTKNALEKLSQFEETNLFLRGIIPIIGLKNCKVEYDLHERFAGASKYTLNKMLLLAIEGITSLSSKPIRLIAALGLSILLISVVLAIYFIFMKKTAPSWASLIVSIWFVGGLQLLTLGIIGEYIGKIYLETKKRPRFIVEKIINDKTRKDSENAAI